MNDDTKTVTFVGGPRDGMTLNGIPASANRCRTGWHGDPLAWEYVIDENGIATPVGDGPCLDLRLGDA